MLPRLPERTDLDLDFDRDRDLDNSLASFLPLCLSYKPVTAAPATPAAAMGIPWRTRLRLLSPFRSRDLFRWCSTTPATAALAKPTCAARRLRCSGLMCRLSDLPREPSLLIDLTDLEREREDLRRLDLLRRSSITVVLVSLVPRFPAAYARAPMPATAASVPSFFVLEEDRLLLLCLRPRSADHDRERDRFR